MNIEPGVPIDLMGALKRRGMLAACIAGAAFLVAYWVAMALPNEYRSFATLLVEPQAVSSRLVQGGVEEGDVNKTLHLMQAEILSRPRLSRIIDELGLYKEESKHLLREEVIDLMRSKVVVIPILPPSQEGIKRTKEIEISTFQVWFTADSPRTAAQVAQVLADDFIKEHIAFRVSTTQKSLEFIEGELARLAQSIAAVENRIAEIKGNNPGRLPSDLLANQRMHAQLTQELHNQRRILDQANSDLAFWRGQALTARESSSPRDEASPTRRLQMLELALAEYRGRGFTDKHTDIIKAKQEMKEVEAAMQASADNAGDGPKSFAQLNTEAEQQRSSARVASTQAEIERLTEDYATVQRRIEETPRVAEQLDSLERQYAQLSSSVTNFSDLRLKATVQANLERRQLGEQFRILEAAFQIPEPSSPNRVLIVAIGLLLGLVAGAAAGIVAEATDSSLHRARDLQAAVNVPVLASIPTILLASDRAALMRTRIRQLVAAGAVVVFCLVGGAVTYVVVNGAPGWMSAAMGDGSSDAPAEGAARATRGPAQRG